MVPGQAGEAEDEYEEGEEEAEEEEVAASAQQDGSDAECLVFSADSKLWKLVREAGDASAAPAPSAPSAPAEGSSCAGGQASGDGAAAPEAASWRWQERGCGVVRVSRHRETGAGRLVMRLKGVLKLLLNTPVLPTTRYEKVGQKSVRFVGVDTERESDGKPVTLCSYRLNLQSGDQQQKFFSAVKGLLSSSKAET